MQKVFIIGLPRTATTSVCHALLGMGFTVAHTCYTTECLANAQVIADTPTFVDFITLDSLFSGAKFIYLERSMESWLPSIKQLLRRMHQNVCRDDGGFNPIIKRCFQSVFSPLTLDNIESDAFLRHCYLSHKQQVLNHFKNRENDLLTIDVAQADSFVRLENFLQTTAISSSTFEKLNIGNKVTAWKQIKHPNKIESTRNGKIDIDIYRHFE
jgi:hypothetical protein